MQMHITFPGGLRANAAYKGFTIETDQPLHGGGDNSAPAPFDYFLASLGTCAGIYVLQFLKKRNMPVDDVAVSLETTRDRERRMLSTINFTVDLPAHFPEKYKNAIINAVNLCAVKKHVHEPPAFETVVRIGEKVVATSTT